MCQTGIILARINPVRAQIELDSIHVGRVEALESIDEIELSNRFTQQRITESVRDNEWIQKSGVGRAIDPVSLKIIRVAADSGQKLVERIFGIRVPVQRHAAVAGDGCDGRSHRGLRKLIVFEICVQCKVSGLKRIVFCLPENNGEGDSFRLPRLERKQTR